MIFSRDYWLRVVNKKLSQGLIILAGLLIGFVVTFLLNLLTPKNGNSPFLAYLPGLISGGGVGFLAYLLIKKDYTDPIKNISDCVKDAFNNVNVQLSQDHLFKCWDVTNCNRNLCNYYMKFDDLRCWETSNEECAGICAECQVYEAAKLTDVGSLIEVIRSYFKKLGGILGELVPLVENLHESNIIIARQTNQFDSTGEQVANRIDNITDAVQTQVSTTQEAVSVIISQGESLKKMVDAATDMTEVISNTASSIDQITRIIDDVATRVNEVNDLSEQATDEAREGGKAVVDAMCGMEIIQGKMDKLNEVLNDLGISSKEIGNIIDTISQISDQTNLLALNAAIEAARAGEHGRGFAVVAEEVRKLANRSTQASNVISEMIQAIQQKVEDTVEVASSGIEEVRTGATLVNTAGDTLEKIITVVRTTSNLMDEISKGTQEQRIGSEDLKKAMVTLKKISSHSQRVVKEQQSENTIVVKAVEDMSMGAEKIAQQALNISIYLAEQNSNTDSIIEQLQNQSERTNKIRSHLSDLVGGNPPPPPSTSPPGKPSQVSQPLTEPEEELVTEKSIVPVEDL